jgi:hypothetical protein
MELQQTVERLNDNSKMLLLEIAKRFLLSDGDWDEDELSPHDLHLIKLAENEYANGETINHNQINWD